MKRVTNAGTFRFKDRLLFIAHALRQHHIGLEEINTGTRSIYFGCPLLARLKEWDYIIHDGGDHPRCDPSCRFEVLPITPLAHYPRGGNGSRTASVKPSSSSFFCTVRSPPVKSAPVSGP